MHDGFSTSKAGLIARVNEMSLHFYWSHLFMTRHLEAAGFWYQWNQVSRLEVSRQAKKKKGAVEIVG
jgi:hypothetical protein